MTKNVTKVAYKPDTQSTDEYLVIVNADEVSSDRASPPPMGDDLTIAAVQAVEGR